MHKIKPTFSGHSEELRFAGFHPLREERRWGRGPAEDVARRNLEAGLFEAVVAAEKIRDPFRTFGFGRFRKFGAENISGRFFEIGSGRARVTENIFRLLLLRDRNFCPENISGLSGLLILTFRAKNISGSCFLFTENRLGAGIVGFGAKNRRWGRSEAAENRFGTGFRSGSRSHVLEEVRGVTASGAEPFESPGPTRLDGAEERLKKAGSFFVVLACH